MRSETDGNGRYSLPSGDRKPWIVVVHKAGIALRSPDQLAASTEITLVPWGRIEGVVKIGTKGAPSHRVWAGLSGRRFAGAVEHTTRTDQDGRFKFDYVAPGRITVGRQVHDVVAAAAARYRMPSRSRSHRAKPSASRSEGPAVRSSAGSLSRRAP